MIENDDSDDSLSTSETGDATTETSHSSSPYLDPYRGVETRSRCSSLSSTDAPKSPNFGGRGRERRGGRKALQPAETEMLKYINKENAYQFMARCVAYPISKPLFDKRLLKDKDNRIEEQDLTDIAGKCEQYLKLKYPKPISSYRLNIQSYIEKVYKIKTVHTTPNLDDDYEIDDKIVLWLYCQVSPGGAAHKLLANAQDGLPGRLNGFKTQYILRILRIYTERMCKREYKKVQKVEDILKSLEETIFRDLVFVKECKREMTPDYYYELLQRLLHIDTQRHKMIYNQNKLDNKEAQIVRLREEADDRDAAMLLNMRRSSVQYTSDIDASKALEHQKQALKLFKENINNGERGCKYHYHIHRASAPRTVSALVMPSITEFVNDGPVPPGSPHLTLRSERSRILSANAHDANFNDFKINFIVGRVVCPKLISNVNFLCIVKCSGCKKRFRSEFKIVKDGKLEFDCQFRFTTKHPNPIIKIKLKEHRDGIFKDSKVLTSTKAMKVNMKFTDIRNGMRPWKTEPMKVTSPDTDGQIDVEYKYDITFDESIKMIGHLKVTGGIWGDKKSLNFFVLYKHKGESEEEHGLQEVGTKGELLKCIDQLTDYDVIQGWNGVPDMDEDDPYGFTLLMEGEEIFFYAKNEDEKNKWVHQIFLLTKQTYQTDDRSRTSSVQSPDYETKMDREGRRRMWPTTDIAANQGKHCKYFSEVLNSMVDFNLRKARPTLDGALHPAHEALLQEYRHRYDINNGIYRITMLECLTRKAEEGYFVEPSLLQQQLRDIRECILRTDLIQIRDDSVERLFENMQRGLRFIFLKFPYNMGETQLFGYSLLFNDLAKDLNRTNEIGQLDEIMKNALERSMEFEYETSIAPSHLIDKDIEKFEFGVMSMPERDKTLESLELITSRCIMFMENFVIFYTDSLDKYGIKENHIKQLAETLFRFYSEDLKRLMFYIPTDTQDIPNTFTRIFNIFKTLNVFCRETTYLTFGEFHTVLLHNAFLMPVLAFVEGMSNNIIAEADREFGERDWEPINRVDKTAQYSCVSVLHLKDRLERFREHVEALEWPNPDFKHDLDDMMQQKHQQIIMKYGELICREIQEQIENTADKTIPDMTLRAFNCLIGLYPQPPINLYPDENRLDLAVLDCIKAMCSPILKYVQKLLADWDDSVIMTLCNLVGSKSKILRVRDFVWYLEYNCVQQSLKHEINPDFIDTLLLEVYKCVICHISDWLETKKRFNRTQIVVLTALIDKIKDIFYHSRRYTGIRQQHDGSCPTELKTQQYENITRVLGAEELKLIDRGEVINQELQDSVKNIISQPNPKLFAVE